MIIAILRSPRFMKAGVHVDIEIAVSSLFRHSIRRVNSSIESYVFSPGLSLPSKAESVGVGSVLKSLCRKSVIDLYGSFRSRVQVRFLLTGVEQLHVFLTNDFLSGTYVPSSRHGTSLPFSLCLPLNNRHQTLNQLVYPHYRKLSLGPSPLVCTNVPDRLLLGGVS